MKHAATNGHEHLLQRLLIVGIVDINVVPDVVEVRIGIGMKLPFRQPSKAKGLALGISVDLKMK